MDGNRTLANLSDTPSEIAKVEPEGPPGTGLTEWEAMDPATLASGNPVQKGHLSDETESEGYLAGVWHCTAFEDRPGLYGVDEYMYLLEGEVVIAMPDGKEVRITAGEAFVIPKGLECQWKMPCSVRKFFMILGGEDRGAAENASLARVTKPTMGPLGDPGGAVERAETGFVNADGRMRVVRRDYAFSMAGPVVSAARRMITVLEGSMTLGGGSFSAGETAYAGPGSSHCEIAPGTRLIEAVFTG